MGIDLIAGGRSKKTKRTAPRSDDVYLKLLVKINKPPISLRKLIHFMKEKENNIAVMVGTVTDDKRSMRFQRSRLLLSGSK
ncbi:60S ribosomal protein L18-3 [Dendrobium catenatum]|uniref:60S ribosomal protein L18-3 n=1 Tax=Dendrobium catenatum TaxID=906689 RepID=A0A2I0WMV2_9ASPA|nr:60S ribosomal protein L18-3 [Dendrobium catenatum]